MMMMMKKQPPASVPNTTPSSLGLNKDSQTISKLKPKIRIIHIFAPEIIKTDVQSFRELVQRLTGKPPEKQSKKRARVPMKLPESSRGGVIPAKKMELRAGFQLTAGGLREKIKGEDEIWSGANSGGGFLGGFPEFDGFMEELNHIPFPILPNLDVPAVYNPADNIAT